MGALLSHLSPLRLAQELRQEEGQEEVTHARTHHGAGGRSETRQILGPAGNSPRFFTRSGQVNCRRRRFPPCGSSPSWLSGAKRGAREGQRGDFPPFSSPLPPHPMCTLLLRTGLSSRRMPHDEIYSEILTKKGKEPRSLPLPAVRGSGLTLRTGSPPRRWCDEG